MRRLAIGTLVFGLIAARSVWALPTLAGSVTAARLCADPACDTVTMTLETERPAPGGVTGMLEIDTVALRVEFDLMLESAVLSGADGIWTRLELRDVGIHGSGMLMRLPIRAAKAGWSITDGSTQVDGSFVAHSPLLFRPFDPTILFFSTPTMGGICRQLTDINCTITFGPGDFEIPFEGGRYLSISLAASVPEPSGLVFVIFGIAVTAGLRAVACGQGGQKHRACVRQQPRLASRAHGSAAQVSPSWARARFSVVSAILAGIALVACVSAEPTTTVASLPKATPSPKDWTPEPTNAWAGDCTTMWTDTGFRLCWRDPVTEYSPQLLCNGECMRPWVEDTRYAEARPIEPFKPKYGFLDWLRDLFTPSDPE